MSNTSTGTDLAEEPNLQEESSLNIQEGSLNIQEGDEEQQIFLQKFNKKFEEEQEQRKMKIVEMEKEKLRMLTSKKKIKNIHDLTLGEILVNTKNAYLDIIIELLSGDYKDGFSTIFTKENRIFYIGVSLLILSFFIYILSFIFDSDSDNQSKQDTDKINIYLNSPTNSEKISTSSPKISTSPKEIKVTATNSSDQITDNSSAKVNNSSAQVTDNSSTDSSATESITNTDKLKINNKLDTSDLKVVEL